MCIYLYCHDCHYTVPLATFMVLSSSLAPAITLGREFIPAIIVTSKSDFFPSAVTLKSIITDPLRICRIVKEQPFNNENKTGSSYKI